MRKLGRPPSKYDEKDQIALREAIERADGENVKKGQNYDLGTSLLILTSPNGTRYAVTVDNAGTLSTSAV